MDATNIIDIQGLTVDFYSGKEVTNAVNDISFQLPNGSTLGIVGESGSGKSVTALSVMGLLPKKKSKISKGSIIYTQYNGHTVDLVTLSEKEMQGIRGNDISMIFQEPMTSLNPVKRCGKQVLETIGTHQKTSKKNAKERVLQLFNEVQLPDPEQAFRSYPHQLSGGQKQRIMIAMALACQPRILIADEPTTALDVTIQKQILELLLKLQQKYKMSIIFITHDLGIIKEVADQIIVMYQGKIVESGSAHHIFHQARHAYTKGLIACRPPIEKRYERLLTVNDFMHSDRVQEGVNEITIKQRQDRLQKIYKADPIAEIEELKTVFTIKRNILGRPVKEKNAVDHVSLKVFPGETLGLVGESGCGKTTLGRSILRLIEPQEGKIFIDGKYLQDLSGVKLRNTRKNLQIVFQDPFSSLNPRVTIGKAITEPMKVHSILSSERERKHKAMDILIKTGLHEKHFYHYPHEFSGGQRQRVCIARALAVNPKFIICDESVSALDVSVQAQVLNLLNALKEEFGLTYIFISHDLSVVKYMSDRIFVMKDGKIIEHGDADEVFFHPKHSYTKRLIDAIPG
jgi:peptide/nickel transport system ATP-binding protein